MEEEMNMAEIKAQLQCETCGFDKICADSSRTINYKSLRDKRLTKCEAWKPLEEEKTAEKQTLTLKIKLPTAEDLKGALKKMFPGIEITVEGEMPAKTLTIKEDEKPKLE